MFLVMGITGKVGGATAEHLLAHGKEVRALVRNRENASSWANQGVELVDGDWNDSAAIERAVKGVEGAFVMLPPVWAPSPDYKEAKGVIANYVEALTRTAPPRVVALSSMGANRTSGLGMITALSLLEQGFRDPDIANRICARRWILRKLPLRLAGRPGRNATGLLQSDKPEIDHGRDE
ncbi:NAD(P)H-binding protein [Bradyrhizobium sp. 482_C4_N1_1]|uniref:NAD(P)H-binding protein n=1 Tax=unclassified Bradyrhizobium TaxID=2631580 RepID=UPI003F8AB81D